MRGTRGRRRRWWRRRELRCVRGQQLCPHALGLQRAAGHGRQRRPGRRGRARTTRRGRWRGRKPYLEQSGWLGRRGRARRTQWRRWRRIRRRIGWHRLHGGHSDPGELYILRRRGRPRWGGWIGRARWQFRSGRINRNRRGGSGLWWQRRLLTKAAGAGVGCRRKGRSARNEERRLRGPRPSPAAVKQASAALVRRVAVTQWRGPPARATLALPSTPLAGRRAEVR